MPAAQPDAHARLETAALALFLEKGYTETTVLDIVQRAGLARRTFFRYFDAKRDVLFWGTGALEQAYITAVATAPPNSSALQMAELALVAAADIQAGRRDVVRRRQVVVQANVELQERQLLKRSERSTVLAQALAARGVDPLDAAVSGEAAVGAYAIAFTRWASGECDDLHESLKAAIHSLRTLPCPPILCSKNNASPVATPRRKRD